MWGLKVDKKETSKRSREEFGDITEWEKENGRPDKDSEWGG